MNIYGVHDANQDWAGILRDFGVSGFAVISEEIGDDHNDYSGNDYSYLAAYGVTPIVRVNYSHHGQGTIPLPEQYRAFAQRCGNFVYASSGCRLWLIGNEPNLLGERPQGVAIMPHQYAECFRLCRNAIKAAHPSDAVMPAAIAPYNADTGWCLDYWREMLSAIIMNGGGADGLALHTYSRSANPASVTSEDKMDAPYQNCYNGFRAYRDFLALVPAILRALPVYITETDQLEPWANTNSGWVQSAYGEIDNWNSTSGHQGIHALCLYRWENYDPWGFCQKNGVIDDFRNALTFDYQAPNTPQPPQPQPPQPQPPEPPMPEPARDIDPKLTLRGVTFDFVKVPAGTGYWRITEAYWLDEEDADAVGPDHHILGQIIKDGIEVADVPLHVSWPSGATTVQSKADDPNASFNYDYAMSKSLNEFSIMVADGNASDSASGIGMGKGGNPAIHTSTWITFEWTISAGAPNGHPTPPPIPSTGDIQTGYVLAVDGLNLRRGPSTEFDVLGTLRYGSTVLSDDEQSGWLHVTDGWVSGQYVGEVTPAPAPPPTSIPAPSGFPKLIWPVRNAVITQRFGEDYDYYLTNYGAEGHNGLDFGLGLGEPIYATADGFVMMADEDKPGYGRFVRLSHPAFNLGSLYAHCDELLVRVGESVSQGQQIATVGSTGNSSGPHCHWELCCQDASGYVNVTYGHSKGRANPEVIMWLLGTPSIYR